MSAISKDATCLENHLPIGWKLTKLGDLIAEARAGFACGLRDDSGVIQLRMNNVDTRGNFVWDAFIRVPAGKEQISEYRLLAGDVLFNNTNSTELVGKTALFESHSEPVVYSNHFTRIRTQEDQLDAAYLSFWLNGEWQCGTFARICNRWIGQSAVKSDKLLTLKIPLPPLSEQKRIAGIVREQLSAVERARSATHSRSDSVRKLRAAILHHTFSSGAEDWPICIIGDVAKVQSGYAFKSEWFSEEGIRLLRNANVFQGYLDWRDEVRLPCERRCDFGDYEIGVGDIILSLDRPVVAAGIKVARATEQDVPSLLLQRVARFRLNGKIIPEFLYAYLSSQMFIRAISQHDYSLGVPHVSPGQVEATSIPLPPVAIQQKVMKRLHEQMEQVTRIEIALANESDAVHCLPAAILRRAFSGGI